MEAGGHVALHLLQQRVDILLLEAEQPERRQQPSTSPPPSRVDDKSMNSWGAVGECVHGHPVEPLLDLGDPDGHRGGGGHSR